jgi:hypothetical protein
MICESTAARVSADNSRPAAARSWQASRQAGVISRSGVDRLTENIV